MNSDFNTLKLYVKNKKLPAAVKLGTVPVEWKEYAYRIACSLNNTSDRALEQRNNSAVKGTEIVDYESLIEFYNQRYIENIDLPEAILNLEGVHHLRFGILNPGGVIPFHLDEPYTLRFICMIHGSHNFKSENDLSFEMNEGELWFINGSFRHSVENTSTDSRIALLGKFENCSSNLRLINELL